MASLKTGSQDVLESVSASPAAGSRQVSGIRDQPGPKARTESLHLLDEVPPLVPAQGLRPPGSRLLPPKDDEDGRRWRYPVALVRDSDGVWVAQHTYSGFGAFEIMRVIFTGADRGTFVTVAGILDPREPLAPARSPFGPGEKTTGLRLPLWLFGVDVRRAELTEPFAEWRPGELVQFETEGDVQAGALLCRRKGSR